MGWGELGVVALVGLASGWLATSIVALRRGAPRKEWLNTVTAAAMGILAGGAVIESGNPWMWRVGAVSLGVGVVWAVAEARRSRASRTGL